MRNGSRQQREPKLTCMIDSRERLAERQEMEE